MNTELAKQVAVQVLAFPENHHQGVWIADAAGMTFSYADTNICPTKACLAGWTIYLNGGSNAIQGIFNETLNLTTCQDYDNKWCEVAAACLNIDTSLALSNWNDNEYYNIREIFLNMDNESAIEEFISLFDLDIEECTLEAKKIREETA